jgi:hypothetical protein
MKYGKGIHKGRLKPQKILEMAKKCLGSILQLIVPHRHRRRKQFYNINTLGLYYKPFYYSNKFRTLIS